MGELYTTSLWRLPFRCGNRIERNRALTRFQFRLDQEKPPGRELPGVGLRDELNFFRRMIAFCA